MTTDAPLAKAAEDEDFQPMLGNRRMRVLLGCGIVATLLYIALDAFSAWRYDGYSYIDQWVSELSAVDAPTRPVWLAVGPIYQLLMVLFGIGVWMAGGERRSLRVAGGLLIAYGLVGFAAPFTPMHTREYLAAHGPALTDRLHLVSTAAAVLLMFSAIGFPAAAFGMRFRIYSAVTVVVERCQCGPCVE